MTPLPERNAGKGVAFVVGGVSSAPPRWNRGVLEEDLDAASRQSAMT
ncbi:MAG TPA: hypothetical protein VG963_11575 [Polyangiaceae bacterium]|nr:hypothetical protein [Polyangiaceae bacterium]